MNDSTAPSGTPLDSSGVVELAVLERNGLIESRHLGAAVVLAPDGSVLRELGTTTATVYPRSSLKPAQAITVLRSGVHLEDAQLVLATASHAGTADHVAVVRAILAAAGLAESQLGCPPDWPGNTSSACEARSNGTGKQRITMNCSGKHAAFLSACVHNGWSLDSYLDPAHPLQQQVRETVEELTGETVAHTGVDGCGAPLFAVSLRGLATATSRVASTRHGEAAALTSAIFAHPWAIDGRDRPNTVVIEELGLLAKGGAEGVIAMSTVDGTAVALKMIDGSPRATSLVALHLLASVGAIDAQRAHEVSRMVTERVLGGDEPVGALRPADGILL